MSKDQEPTETTFNGQNEKKKLSNKINKMALNYNSEYRVYM